jgi:hypothetical protein
MPQGALQPIDSTMSHRRLGQIWRTLWDHLPVAESGFSVATGWRAVARTIVALDAFARNHLVREAGIVDQAL